MDFSREIGERSPEEVEGERSVSLFHDSAPRFGRFTVERQVIEVSSMDLARERGGMMVDHAEQLRRRKAPQPGLLSDLAKQAGFRILTRFERPAGELGSELG